MSGASANELFIVVRFVRQSHRQAVVVHRHQLELEAAGLVQPVDLLLDLRVNDTRADIFVDGVIGEAQIVLVSQEMCIRDRYSPAFPILLPLRNGRGWQGRLWKKRLRAHPSAAENRP